MNNLDNLNDLEYRLWQLQGEVNRAMQDLGKADPMDVNRLDHMESEICYLQRQVAALKKVGRENPSFSAQPRPFGEFRQAPCGQPVLQQGPRSYGQLQPGQGASPQQGGQFYDQSSSQQGPLPYGRPQPGQGRLPGQVPLPYGRPLPQGSPMPSKASGEKDLEKTLGTGIMGIIASVLIFISIIIFGSLLLPYLTDVVMTVMMFLFSFLLFGAGYLLLRKNPGNKFNISLCACGATAICVSLFVTRLYFALINDLAFLLFVALWLALMACVCQKYQNLIFRIIGEIGVFLTVCLGTVRFVRMDMGIGEWFMFCMLLSVYGCSTLLLDRIIRSGSYEKNAFFHSIRTVVLLLALIVFVGNAEAAIGTYAGFVVSTVCFAAELYRSFREELQDGCLFYCLMSVDFLTYCTILCGVFRLESFLPYYIAAVLLAVVFEMRQTKNSTVGNVIACLLFWWSGWAWLHTGAFYTAAVALPLFAYGYVRKNRIPLYIGLFGILGVIGADITVSSFVLLWAVPFICFVVLARVTKDQVFTALGYPLYMLCGAGMFSALFQGFGFETEETAILAFLILAVVHMLIIRMRAFAKDGTGFAIVSGVMTVFLMICGSWAVYQEYFNVCSMLVTAALYTINTVNLLKKSEHFGYYIGLKYTVCMILLVDAHFEFSMLISVLMLLFAAGSIAFGFYKNCRSFRIYGLILSMVSIFKLILFDVSSKSAVYNAVGFLVCGLICFGISFLYNKIENRMKEK